MILSPINRTYPKIIDDHDGKKRRFNLIEVNYQKNADHQP
ncbi:hypothetical protein N0824_00974 [Microcystis sp. 0824]|nr:hypothetical protein N0824_00974 [Microcystis sp. 0824]